MGGDPGNIARDVAAISRVDAVPGLLAVICEATGLRFAFVAAVIDSTWTACAVRDNLQCGVKPGEEIAIDTGPSAIARASAVPAMIARGNLRPVYFTHPALAARSIHSHFAAPILLSGGRRITRAIHRDPRS